MSVEAHNTYFQLQSNMQYCTSGTSVTCKCDTYNNIDLTDFRSERYCTSERSTPSVFHNSLPLCVNHQKGAEVRYKWSVKIISSVTLNIIV